MIEGSEHRVPRMDMESQEGDFCCFQKGSTILLQQGRIKWKGKRKAMETGVLWWFAGIWVYIGGWQNHGPCLASSRRSHIFRVPEKGRYVRQPSVWVSKLV